MLMFLPVVIWIPVLILPLPVPPRGPGSDRPGGNVIYLEDRRR